MNSKKEDILQYIKKHGKITVSYQTLSVLFNIARPNIITLLQELENDGKISIERNKVESANTPNTYIYKEG